jgi:nitroreductase
MAHKAAVLKTAGSPSAVPTDARQPLPDALRLAVESATKAPSIHNTQPWLFHLSGSAEAGAVEAGAVDLFADRSRSLPALDPTGRQLETSCGVALLFLRVSLRASGFNADVTLLPDHDPDHFAHVAVVRGPEATADEQALASAIPRWRSQRSAFQARTVEPELLADFRRAAESEGAWLVVVHRRDDQIDLITLLSRADQEEARDPAYQEELRAWLRTEPSSDGVPVAAVPAHVERHSDVVVRDFNPGRIGEQSSSPGAVPPVDEDPALVVLGTDGDGAGDHLVAGMALGRVLLHATAHEVSASLLGQVMDLPGPRAALRTALNLIGEPQTVLRMGYGDGTTEPVAGRRALDEVLLP